MDKRNRKGPHKPVVDKPAAGNERDCSSERSATREIETKGLTPIEPPPKSKPVDRRRFLSLISASAALAAMAACKSPDRGTIVPYTKKPADVIPGVSDYYASTYQEGLVPYSVLIKTRDGRPIHLDGNDEHPVFNGKTSLRAQAEVMGLYNPDRLQGPKMEGRNTDWKTVQQLVISALKKAATSGKGVLLLTPALISPTGRKVIEGLKARIPSLRHIQWEPAVSPSGRKALESLYGEALTPSYHLDAANVILSVEADFLGAMDTQISAIAGYAKKRKALSPTDKISRMYVVEGAMSLTGSKADHRMRLRPSQAPPFLFAIARMLNEKHGVTLPGGFPAKLLTPFDIDAISGKAGMDREVVRAMINDLARERGKSLVLAGPSLSSEAHVAAALINTMLGAEGNTVDTDYAPDSVPLASTADIAKLAEEMNSGAFDVAVFWGVNPLYALPAPEPFRDAMDKVPLTIRLGLEEDETAKACGVVLPINHWIESWGDYEAGTNLLSLQQPVIRPLYDTLQAEEILLSWATGLGASMKKDYRSYLMNRWKQEIYPRGSFVSFESFWNAALHDGILRIDSDARPPRTPNPNALKAAAKLASKAAPPSGIELLLSPDMKLWDGRYANVGWLQELPQPIGKVSWGNSLSLSIVDAHRLKLNNGDLVKVATKTGSLVLPVLVQPGQAEGVVSTTLGFGRTTGSVANGVGGNAFALSGRDGTPFLIPGVKVDATGSNRPLIRTQEQFNLHGRDEHITHLWSMSEYAEEAAKPKKKENLATLYPKQDFPDHKWGMAIDQSACVGCAICEIACQSENNIPVVGPEHVATGRIMHWMRIDSYSKGDPDNPKIVHQPMLCQQCDDAPCETVCPVAATTHSPEGLNQMVYNRCVGTRYCSNNCPYKVRRFNFFDYTSFIEDPLDLAFNPEVTVRPRGVMEKCTFCVQRIRNGEQVARDEGRPVQDGDIRPACAMACPADAIVFGDLKDQKSQVSKLTKSNRGYKVLEDLGTRPSVTYLAELRNPAENGEDDNV